MKKNTHCLYMQIYANLYSQKIMISNDGTENSKDLMMLNSRNRTSK